MARGWGRWVRWLSRAVFSPWLRGMWGVASAAVTIGFLIIGCMDQSTNIPSWVARTPSALLLTICGGLALGLAGAVQERYQLVHQRSEELEFHRACFIDRLRWRYQQPNLVQNGWLMIALGGLMAWSIHQGVTVLAPLCAVEVPFLLNLRLTKAFSTELREVDTVSRNAD
jgi:hypothetical protein